MKHLLLLILISLSTTVFSQTNWIKGKAVWNYQMFSAGYDGALRIETTIDTLIQGRLCQQLKLTHHRKQIINQYGDFVHLIDSSFEYIHFNQDTVWYLKDNVFQVLYNFTASQGSTRFMGLGYVYPGSACNDSSYLKIDNVYTGNLNGENMTFFEVSDSSSNTIIHGGKYNSHFGMMSTDMDYSHNLFPSQAWCMENSPDESMYYSLRCFQDDSLDYNPSNLDCDYYTYLSMDEMNLFDVQVFPNPAVETFTVKSNSPISQLTIINMQGQVLESITDIHATEFVFNVMNYDAGIYFLQVQTINGNRMNQKIQVITR